MMESVLYLLWTGMHHPYISVIFLQGKKYSEMPDIISIRFLKILKVTKISHV